MREFLQGTQIDEIELIFFLSRVKAVLKMYTFDDFGILFKMLSKINKDTNTPRLLNSECEHAHSWKSAKFLGVPANGN